MCAPVLIDTDTSLALQNNQMQEVYNLESAAMNAGLNYDCAVFDKNGACLSIGGRFSDVGSNAANAFSGTVIGGYHLNQNIRIGGYVDQNVANDTSGGVRLRNNAPLFGLFGTWSQNTDGTGFEGRLSTGLGENDLTTARTPLFAGGSLAGTGETRIYNRGAAATLSYGVPVDGQWLATPYAGLRETDVTRAGYTEHVPPALFASPLTYGTLSEQATTGMAGIHLKKKITPKFTLDGAAGLEHDFAHSGGSNAATGLFGFLFGTPGTAVSNFGHYRTTRGVASLSGFFDVTETQHVVAGLSFRQEALQDANTITGQVAYQVGF